MDSFMKSHFFISEMKIKNPVAVIHALYARWCVLSMKQHNGVAICLRPEQNGRHFAYDIFNCIFSIENVRILIKIPLKFVPRDPIDNKATFEHWFR